jgi:hypothetical protein
VAPVQEVQAEGQRLQRSLREVRRGRRSGVGGGIVGLRRTLRAHPEAVEADLHRYYQIDLADHWRRVDGRRALSLRKLRVLIRHLPTDSALATAENGGKPIHNQDTILLAEIATATAHAKKPHPVINEVKSRQRARRDQAPSRRRALVAARRRAEQRRRAIEAGEIR